MISKLFAAKKKVFTGDPVFGPVLYVVLYIIATLLYLGGSQV
jgi:hypothetical protein